MVNQSQHAARVIVGLDRGDSCDDLVLAAALNQARLTRAVLSVVHAIAPETAIPPEPVDIGGAGT